MGSGMGLVQHRGAMHRGVADRRLAVLQVAGQPAPETGHLGDLEAVVVPAVLAIHGDANGLSGAGGHDPAAVGHGGVAMRAQHEGARLAAIVAQLDDELQVDAIGLHAHAGLGLGGACLGQVAGEMAMEAVGAQHPQVVGGTCGTGPDAVELLAGLDRVAARQLGQREAVVDVEDRAGRARVLEAQRDARRRSAALHLQFVGQRPRHAETAVLALAAFGAQAQDAKPSKEREALRRTQTALRAAQELQSTLQADKAKAEAEAAAAHKEAASTKAQIAGSAARLKAREAELETLRAQLLAAKQAEQAQQEAAAKSGEREQALQQQLLAARQESASRLQANQALSQLLERSTQALADAEAKNRQLYTLGQDLLKRWRGRSAIDTALLQDPVLGLTAVRFEDEAEKLRSELETKRIVR